MPRYCSDTDCTKRALYNVFGNKPIFCKDHKCPLMIDVMHTRCKTDGCDKISPHFNYEGETKGLYCKIHGNKFKMIDIVNKRCKGDGCDKISPCFNYEGETSGLYCKEHASPDMVDVKNKKCTEHGTQFNHCKYCGGVSYEKYLKSATCKTIGCDVFINNRKYKGYCMKCFMRAYPNEPVCRNYKIKEQHVVDAVKKEFSNLTWSCDKRYDFAPTECGSRRRPDMFCHFGNYVIIIEVDENQHTGYDSTCENKRLCELYQDFNFAQLVFIRFNPDSYIGEKDGKNVTSCFGIDKNRICTIKKGKQIEWNTRLNLLYKTIREYATIIDDADDITKSITTCNLWFDSK
jgi:hypothetical protein